MMGNFFILNHVTVIELFSFLESFILETLHFFGFFFFKS